MTEGTHRPKPSDWPDWGRYGAVPPGGAVYRATHPCSRLPHKEVGSRRYFPLTISVKASKTRTSAQPKGTLSTKRGRLDRANGNSSGCSRIFCKFRSAGWFKSVSSAQEHKTSKSLPRSSNSAASGSE